MEGVRLFKWDEIGVTNVTDAKHVAARDLKQVLE
jgi:phenylalanyl-tRNA synthetase alpha chain